MDQWWRPEVHEGRRAGLLARTRIQAALPGIYELVRGRRDAQLAHRPDLESPASESPGVTD